MYEWCMEWGGGKTCCSVGTTSSDVPRSSLVELPPPLYPLLLSSLPLLPPSSSLSSSLPPSPPSLLSSLSPLFLSLPLLPSLFLSLLACTEMCGSSFSSFPSMMLLIGLRRGLGSRYDSNDVRDPVRSSRWVPRPSMLRLVKLPWKSSSPGCRVPRLFVLPI